MTAPNDNKAQSKERFNRYAAGYVTNATHAKGAELDRLIEIARPLDTWRVLDVATGGGHTALKFAPFVAHVIASDITPNMLEEARAHITGKGIESVDFQIADAEDLPFESDSFDLVTCRIAPHHFPQTEQFVKECARVVKPGGLVLVQDQVAPEDYVAARYVDAFEKLRDPSHNLVYSQSEWVAMFNAAHLTVEHTEQFTKRHDLVHWGQMQGNLPHDIERLQVLLTVAPPSAAEWFLAENAGTPEASFVNHHLIISGRKAQA